MDLGDHLQTAQNQVKHNLQTLELMHLSLLRLGRYQDQLAAHIQNANLSRSSSPDHHQHTEGISKMSATTVQESPDSTRGEGDAFAYDQVVILRVNDGDFAVPIKRVQEIVRVPALTCAPGAGRCPGCHQPARPGAPGR